METRLILKVIKDNKAKLTRQQVKTIRGQVLSGDIEGARKGLKRLGLYA